MITFDHHPDEILTGSAPPLLCDPDERLERLAAAGVDTTVVVHFDQRLRETTYDAFVAMIARPGAARRVPDDARRRVRLPARAGRPTTLAALGAERGFEVVVVPPFELDGRPVRSTEVRTAIAAGDLEAAAHLLGRAHCVVGQAVSRATTGPAACSRFPLPVALPPDGTYAVEVGPRATPARPTRPSLEAGSVRLVGTPPAPWVRVAFTAGG